MSGSDSDSSSPNMALDMECEFFSEDGHSTEEEVDSNTQVDPYMFEPVTDESDSEGTPENPGLGYMDNRRTENTEWCKCGQCIAHPTAEECSCCQENPTIEAKIKEVEREGLPPVNCITQHPGFAGVCCNRWVLQTAYFQYRSPVQQYGEVDVADQAVNRRYRHTGYRPFVRWCCGYLGRKVRVLLPACAVRDRRTEFPSEEFCGFKYPSLE